MASVKEIFAKIEHVLGVDPARTGGLDAVYQFNLTGDEAAVYQIILKPDSAAVTEGETTSANCTLQMAADDFKDLVEGRLSGTTALMSGKLRVKGNIGLAMRLESVLGAYLT